MMDGDKMATITITLKPQQLLQLRLQIPAMLDIARNNIKQRLQDQGRSLIHSKLGRWQSPGGGVLAQSLEVRVGPELLEMAIGAGLSYTQSVFSGAIPHRIEGKGDYPLHWNRFGRDFYFWSVMHPGQEARFDILLELQELARRIAREEVEAVFRAMALA